MGRLVGTGGGRLVRAVKNPEKVPWTPQWIWKKVRRRQILIMIGMFVVWCLVFIPLIINAL